MLTNGLVEIIFCVDDMHAQVEFYRDVLELEMLHPRGLQDCSGEHWLVFGAGACKLALHAGGQPQAGAGAPKLVFAVTDVAAARAQLLERGVALDEPFSPAPGEAVANGRDPEGNPFSLESHSAT